MGVKRKRWISKQTEAELRELVNAWNPIAVEGLPADEYDCLLALLWRNLVHKSDRKLLERFLCDYLEDHFGLPPESSDIPPFVVKILDWYQTRKPI